MSASARVVGKYSIVELAGIARAMQNMPSAHWVAPSACGVVGRWPVGVRGVADADADRPALVCCAFVHHTAERGRDAGFHWLLVGLAALDAENLWLPDRLIFPGLLLGIFLSLARPALDTYYIGWDFAEWKHRTGMSLSFWFLGLVIPTALIFIIRHVYRVFRNKDGIGTGDVKLVAMLGGWLGARVALLAFGIGVLTAAAYAMLLYANPTLRGDGDSWLEEKLPFGTFLAIGGIVGALWVCRSWPPI